MMTVGNLARLAFYAYIFVGAWVVTIWRGVLPFRCHEMFLYPRGYWYIDCDTRTEEWVWEEESIPLLHQKMK